MITFAKIEICNYTNYHLKMLNCIFTNYEFYALQNRYYSFRSTNADEMHKFVLQLSLWIEYLLSFKSSFEDQQKFIYQNLTCPVGTKYL
jgi:hypothetical protein